MALGAVTPQIDDPTGPTITIAGDLKITVTNVVGDSSYPTGGSALTPQQLGLGNKVLFAQGEAIATTGASNGASAVYYNTATGKLQVFTTGATGLLNEVANAVNTSGITWQVIAFGY